MTKPWDLSYLSAALHPDVRMFKLRQAARILRRRRHLFDGLVCTGLSGVLMAPTLAERLGLPLAVLRKTTKGCHGYPLEGVLAKRLCFVDDFVETGHTFKRVRKAVAARGSVVTAFYCYGQYDQEALLISGPRLMTKPSKTLRSFPHDPHLWVGKNWKA